VLGLLYYAVTQGAQFFGLELLPAATVSLMLNFTPILVALLGFMLREEQPTRRQWIGVGVNLTGVLIYFLPVVFTAGQWRGMAIMVMGTAANALSAVLGRKVNREAPCDALSITAVSMALGAVVLLGTGLMVQGLPPLAPPQWGIVVWLAVVNTAVAFTLWNHTLRSLTATDSSLINSTMLPQIAVLAWVCLGEALGVREIVGLVFAVLGVLLVQLR
jgi:drug/metabolite transporter (DMT)-like permease